MISTVEGSRLASSPGLPPELFIVTNDALEAILFDRNVTGLDFKRNCRAASRAFMRHLADQLESQATSELMILSKGVAYQLSDAAESELDLNLPLNLISTTRAVVDGDQIQISVTYQRFDAGGAHLIIGDTVASGETIVAALEAYRAIHHLESVTVLSYAGSIVGARRIIQYCRDSGVCCAVMFGLAAFGLGENGFDLSFMDPATVTEAAYRLRAERQFGARPVSAVGWDFGTQYLAPEKYANLCWAEAVHWGMVGHSAFALAKEPAQISVLENEASAFTRKSILD